MAEQVVDKKSVGIPSDIPLVRHQTELFMIRAEGYASSAEQSSLDAADSETQAAEHAELSNHWANVAKGWSERYSQGIHFGPDEPSYEQRYDGMLWLMTDESKHEIIKIRRWDAASYGVGLYLSDELFLSDSLYPQDRGEWTDFTINLK